MGLGQSGEWLSGEVGLAAAFPINHLTTKPFNRSFRFLRASPH